VGKGKSTLLRAIAGIWPFGSGRIEGPRVEQMMFVPQLPYLPLGTLRAAISYPTAEGGFPDARIREVLVAIGLAHLAGRLDEEQPWKDALSGLEKQLLAFARVLLQEPRWILLDDAMSGVDDATERHIYEVLLQRLPRAALISLGTRAGVIDLFPRRWTLAERPDGSTTLEAA
jgi:putative ATP-binding cassette transporter